MQKRKKLTEKEWKRQLEEKAAFEAAEEAKAEQLINNKLRAAQIGTKIVGTSTPNYPETIVKIDLEELDDDYFDFTCWTDCGSCYDINDFFNNYWTGAPASVIFCPEAEQEEPNEDQLTFDDVAYSTNETAENSADSTTVCENEEKAAFSPVWGSSSSTFGEIKRKNWARILKIVRAAAGGGGCPESFKNCTAAVGRGSPP